MDGDVRTALLHVDELREPFVDKRLLRVYLILSLVAKSALAWQVYGGALAGG